MYLFKVLNYSSDNLAVELSNKFTSVANIKNKNHFKYFEEYLGPKGINGQTIVVESDYINKDFLSDYSSYYSLCFNHYEKRCKRLHFFKNKFTEDDFKGFLINPEKHKDFWHFIRP
jgi:hypothetical protein